MVTVWFRLLSASLGKLKRVSFLKTFLKDKCAIACSINVLLFLVERPLLFLELQSYINLPDLVILENSHNYCGFQNRI